MPEAAMTSGQPENDSVRPPLSLDDASELDIYDPDEDQETVETGQAEQSESETDETEDGQESEEIEASENGDDDTEGEEQGEQGSTPEPNDDVTVTMSNGEQLKLSELKKGYFREADYTRQKQAVSTKEKSLDALTSRVTKSVDAIADFLAKQIPDAPDPSLAMTNPGEFVQRKAMHDAAMAQVSAILTSANDVKDVAKTLSDEQRRDLLAEENAKLAEAFPQTATPEGRTKFFTNAASAAKELGYSEDEIKGVMDNRMFKLAHYAALGLAAEKAKEKAKTKVANVPPVTPQKRPQSQNAQTARSKDAMKRLARSGSIEDAMAIDFD